MLPAGKVTEDAIKTLVPLLAPGDTIIDAGNTNFHDDQRRAEELKPHGITYVDQGTSGGIWGLEIGFCLMVGGDTEVVQRLEPAFKTLAPEDGYGHFGPVGAGHFVKMIHNGIEYGMMQAYAEGLRDPARQAGVQPRSASDLGCLEPWQRGALLAARADRDRL